MKKSRDLSQLYSSLPAGIRANVLRLNVIKFSKWFMIVMPMIVPFYRENGLTLSEIMLLKSIYSVVIVALELPSGYLADFVGRRKTLIAGAFLGTAGYACYSFSGHYLGFVIAEIALGAGTSFISGADSAMLYDTLAVGRREKEYTRYEGINASIGNFSEAFAGIAGGALALISLRFPFFVQVAVAATAIPAALTLREPGKTSIQRKRHKPGDLFVVIRNVIIREKTLRYNLLLSSIIGAATLLMAWYAQPLFEEIGVPLILYGVLWTALNLTVGFSSIVAHKIETGLGETNTLILLAVAIPLLMVITGLLPPAGIIPILFLIYAVRGIATPVLKDYVNKNTSSEVRATVMSLRDLILRVQFALLAPVAGWLSDRYSLSSGIVLTGLFILGSSTATLLLFNRHRRRS
jgi:MFS family permease